MKSNKNNKSKVQDVLDIIYPSGEFAEEAMVVLRGCISEITGYPEESIDMTAFGSQVDLMDCDVVKVARECMKAIERQTLQYLQEQ